MRHLPYATLSRRVTQLICALLLAIPLAAGGESYRLTLIDVGYGLSILAQDSDGTAILFDGGYREEAPLVRTALAQAGIDSLALMVASHGHGDHIEGLAVLLQKRFPVGLVIGNVPQGHASFDSLFWRSLGGVPYRQARAGDSLAVGSLQLQVLHPDTLTENLNESSMAVSLTLGTHRVLLPADIGVHTQEALATRWGQRLRSGILVAPHHGDVIARGFWDAVKPEWVLVPVGPNPWELPDSRVTRLTAEVRLIDTHRDGTVILTLDRGGISLISRTPHSCTQRREADMAERMRRWRRAH